MTRMGLMLLEPGDDDYGIPTERELQDGGIAVFLSDFLGDWDRLERALEKVASQRVSGCLMQILDPTEVEFPFDGRRIFESMGGDAQVRDASSGRTAKGLQPPSC